MSTITPTSLSPSLSLTAWVLNLDAEKELAQDGAVTRSRSMQTRIDALTPLIHPQLGLGASVIGLADGPGTWRGYQGEAWCPTPSALRRLACVGAQVGPMPPLEVLRRVNHRRFCAALGQTLPDALYVDDMDTLEQHLGRPGIEHHWVLKRPYGFTGRGRILVSAGRLDNGARSWVEASLRHGEGLQVEPWVRREGDFALHGRIASDGSFRLGAPTRQHCDEHGGWVSSARTNGDDLSSSDEQALTEAVVETADALSSAGYFGPFGVDAFCWVDSHGCKRFNPRCEINARYSMGWFLGMGHSTGMYPGRSRSPCVSLRPASK